MKINPYSPEIRFSDIDAMGHVNNAVYLSYFEQARIHFFRQLIGGAWDWKNYGILVARNEVDYKRPVHLRDQVRILIGCSHIGTKSFTITYRLERMREDQAEVCTTGASVLVCFDHQAQSTLEVPDLWREQLELLRSV